VAAASRVKQAEAWQPVTLQQPLVQVLPLLTLKTAISSNFLFETFMSWLVAPYEVWDRSGKVKDAFSAPGADPANVSHIERRPVGKAAHKHAIGTNLRFYRQGISSGDTSS
jgi:hypothetical protein